jgi:hypothetical protein
MGACVWWIMTMIQSRVGNVQFTANAVTAIVAAAAGLLVYVACATLMRVQELRLLRSLLKR